MASRPQNSLTKNLPEDCTDRLDPIKSIVAFAKARESVRIRKEANLPREEWTDDEILKKAKFTNVRREYDRVSVEIFDWVKDVDNDVDLLLNLLFARHCNKLSTLRHVGIISVKDDPNVHISKIQELKPMFANPYQCPAQYKTINKFDTREEWIFKFFPKVAEFTVNIIPKCNTILEITNRMVEVWEWNNGFCSMQALLDFFHIKKNDLVKTEVKIGPGAVPALKLLNKTIPELLENDDIKLICNTYANVEHLLCEWRKYIELKHKIRHLRGGLLYK